MKLTDFNQIEEDGLDVFMPTGIQATLFQDGDKIKVVYSDAREVRYSKDDFAGLMKEDIFIFNRRPTTQVMEYYNDSKTLKDFLGIDEKDFNNISDLIKYIEENTDYDVTSHDKYSLLITDRNSSDGEEIEIMINKGLEEAYNMADNKEGEIFKVLHDEKRKEYLTPGYKIAMIKKLEVVAKEYPDPKVRQQAVTFMDELGVGKYYDMKKVQDFVNDHIDVLKPNEVNEEYGPRAGEPEIEHIGGEVESGNKEGFEPYIFGNWKLTTSLDDRWEALTSNMRDYIMEQIAMPIKDGHESYVDVDIIIHSGSGLNEDDLKSLDVFSEEEIKEMLASEDKDIETWISYDLEYDEDVEDMEEAFKVKKAKKKKLAELTEDCYKVYNTIEGQECGTFSSWNEVEEYLNAAYGEYETNLVDKEGMMDKDTFMGNFDFAIIELPVEVTDEICPTCGEVPCNCDICACNPETCQDELGQACADIEVPQDAEVIETPQEVIEEEPSEVIELNIDQIIDEMCEDKNEEFSDNMGMLTDINDLDFPDALHNAVDTKEDGALYRLSDVAKMIQELKAELEGFKSDFKAALGELKQDIKLDVKDIQTDVTSKLDNTQDAISDLTAEEEEIEDIELEEPAIEEEPAEDEESEDMEEPTEEEGEQVEESFTNPLYTSVSEAVKSLKGEKVTMQEFFSILGSEHKINTRIGTIASAVTSIVEKHFAKTIIPEHINESYNKATKQFLRHGYMEELATVKKDEQYKNAFMREDVEQAKQEIDRLKSQGNDEKKIKSAIALTTDNDQEAKEATEYAIDKMSESKADQLKAALLKTSAKAELNNLKR